MTEEKEKYAADEPQQGPTPSDDVHMQDDLGQDDPNFKAPISKLSITFMGPGMAQFKSVDQDGIVTVEQIASMAVFFLLRAVQEWSVPFIQSVVRNTIADFMSALDEKKEAEESQIMTAPPGMIIPPDLLRGGGKPS